MMLIKYANEQKEPLWIMARTGGKRLNGKDRDLDKQPHRRSFKY